MNKLLTILIITIFTSCLRNNDSDFSPNTRTHSFSERSISSIWPYSVKFPLSLKYSSEFNEDEITALNSSANSWSDSVQNEVHFFDLSSSEKSSEASLSNYNDNELGIYKLEKWPKDLPQTALAVTQIFASRLNSGQANERIDIQHADILVNFESFTFSTDGSWGHDLETVILHEMGHFLGLYHDYSSAELSIMFPTINRHTNNQSPKEKDIEHILNKYSLSKRIEAYEKSRTSSTQGKKQDIVIILELYPNGVEKIKIETLKRK